MTWLLTCPAVFAALQAFQRASSELRDSRFVWQTPLMIGPLERTVCAQQKPQKKTIANTIFIAFFMVTHHNRALFPPRSQRNSFSGWTCPSPECKAETGALWRGLMIIV